MEDRTKEKVTSLSPPALMLPSHSTSQAHKRTFDSIQAVTAYIRFFRDKNSSGGLQVQLGELASQVSVLRQRSLVPLFRVTPFLLELGDDILVGVRVELWMLEKHTEDGAPAAVESASNPT